jgi:hypothetical protein
MDSRQKTDDTGKADGTTSGVLRQAARARTSRRALLRRGGFVAAGSVAALTMLDQRRAEAATGSNFVLGQGNNANNTTTLSVTSPGTTLVPLFRVDGTGLSGTSTSMVVDGPGSLQGKALVVNGQSGGTGIITSAANGSGGTIGLALAASGSNGADAIHASSDKGTAVSAASNSGKAISGTSSKGTGVTGKGKHGGVFSGTAAAVQLVPSAGTHPTHGTKGDLFVDHNVHLWFCRGGTNWVKLA